MTNKKQKGKTDFRYIELGRRLREVRKMRELTLEQVAKEFNLTFQQIQKYESGQNRTSTLIFEGMCALYNVSMSDILSELDQPEWFNSLLLTGLPLFEDFDQEKREWFKQERKILDYFSELSDEYKLFAQNFMRELVSIQKGMY